MRQMMMGLGCACLMSVVGLAAQSGTMGNKGTMADDAMMKKEPPMATGGAMADAKTLNVKSVKMISAACQ